MGLISSRDEIVHNSAGTVKEEKEPTPCSSKLPAPIRGLIGCEMVQIGSMLLPVLAFRAFLGCRRARRRVGGLGLGRLLGFATTTRGGFAVAGGWGGGYWNRSVCGFAHIISLMFFGCNRTQSGFPVARDMPDGFSARKRQARHCVVTGCDEARTPLPSCDSSQLGISRRRTANSRLATDAPQPPVLGGRDAAPRRPAGATRRPANS